MTGRTLAAIATLCMGVAACGADPGGSVPPTGPPAWNHDPGNADLGPGGWGSIDASFEACSAGEEQSPIDIVNAIPTDLPPLEFDYAPVEVVVENTGHTIEVPMEDAGAPLTMTVEADEYRLLQYHVHAPSEHTVDGRPHDMELHLVHQNEAGELAVVAVLFNTDAGPNELMDLVIAGAPEATGEAADVGRHASPIELLPIDAQSDVISRYATYDGSLTTPGCAEGVRWIVVEDTLGVAQATTDRLHDLIAAFPGYGGYANNNRPTQPLNDRELHGDAE